MIPPPNKLRHLILSLAAVSVALCIGAQSTRVNLLNPTFETAETHECRQITGAANESLGLSCSLNLWTRAAQYQVSNITTVPEQQTATGPRPTIKRIGSWTEPAHLKDLTGFSYGNRSTRSSGEQLIKLTAAHLGPELANTGLFHVINSTLFPYVRCEAKAQRKSPDTGFYCARESSLAICKEGQGGKPSCSFIFHKRSSRYPVSAMAVEKFESKDFLFEIDSMGFLSVYQVNDLMGGSFDLELKNSYLLNGLASSLEVYLNRGTKGPLINATHVDDSLLAANKAIKKEATELLEERLEYTHITAISPQNQSYTPESYNKTLDTICFSSGLQSYKKHGELCPTRGRPVKYSQASGPGNYAEIHAMSHVDLNGSSIENIFYTLYQELGSVDNPRYFHCTTSKGLNKTGKPTATIYDARPLPANPRDEDCGYQPIDVVPNDVVPFYDAENKCAKQIVFHSVVYQVFNITERLSNRQAVKYEPKFNFYIHAAFSHGGMFYFFSGANTLVIIPARMTDNKCNSLQFNFASAREVSAHAYMFEALDLRFNSKPLTVDYQELADGDRDTKPALLKQDDIVGPGPKVKGSSNVIIISIAFVIGGLVLAGIIYVCFVMSGSSPAERRQPPKSRRARPTTNTNSVMDNLGSTKTLRSHLQSKLGSKLGSKIQSPGRKPKSKRAAKSIANALKSNKSKGKSPTSLTTVKVSHGEPIPVTRDQASASSSPSTGSGGTKSPVSSQKSSSSASKLTPRSPRSPSQQSSGGGSAKSPKS